MRIQNSLSPNLIAYYQALFSDIAWLYPRRSGWERDRSRLLHELAYHGSRIATLDLPALGKHFDKCLDQGQYTPSRLPLGALRRRGQVPVFLQDLFLQVFDLEGKLRDTPSLDAITALRTLFLSMKSLRVQCSERSTRNAVHAFLGIEAATLPPSLPWDEDELPGPDSPTYKRLHFADVLQDRDRARGVGDQLFDNQSRPAASLNPRLPALLGRLQRVCDVVATWLAEGYTSGGLSPKHGPGVTAEMGKWDDKFQFPSWPWKLEQRFPYDIYGLPSWSFVGDVDGAKPPIRSERPSRLIAVPKTQKTPRLIAAEPTSHQWIQQLLKKQLEAALLRTPLSRVIRFTDQEQNRKMAYRGSIDGSLATVDLSSASDCLSCYVVERAFRSYPDLLADLHASRTRWLSYRCGGLDGFIRLKKFAPMGSAVTFPVQSIFYACVALAALGCQNRADIDRCSSRLSVFGDDIIIPTHALEDLKALLEILGFHINSDKTFSDGFFRESCGAEWFFGNDVTVPKVLTPLGRATNATMMSLVATRNNFYSRGWWHIAALYDEICFGATRPRSVPLGSAVPGLFSVTRGKRRLRFSSRYHRFEEWCLSPYSTKKTADRDGVSRLHLWFITEPEPLSFEGGRILESSSYWRWGWRPVVTPESYSVVQHGHRSG